MLWHHLGILEVSGALNATVRIREKGSTILDLSQGFKKARMLCFLQNTFLERVCTDWVPFKFPELNIFFNRNPQGEITKATRHNNQKLKIHGAGRPASIYLSIHPSIHLSIHPSIYLSIYPVQIIRRSLKNKKELEMIIKTCENTTKTIENQ